MEDSELVGGVLLDTADPARASQHLANLLLTPGRDPLRASRFGLDPDLVEVLRVRMAGDEERIIAACAAGAAWVLGRRSVPVRDTWELVGSLPGGVALPRGLQRTTGETLLQLVVQAQRTLRIAVPFIDRSGLSHLGDALAAATTRGVTVEILLPTRSTHAGDALHHLADTIRRSGAIDKLQVIRLDGSAPWTHLKVITSDSIAAYIGSANITEAGIGGSNLELGVLVQGPTVRVVERFIELCREN